MSSFLPRGYSTNPNLVRWEILQTRINEVGIDKTFSEFSKEARYRVNTSRGDVYTLDLQLLMICLPTKECEGNKIFSVLSNNCINDTTANRRKQQETWNLIRSLPKAFEPIIRNTTNTNYHSYNSILDQPQNKNSVEINNIPKNNTHNFALSSPHPRELQYPPLTKLSSVMLASKFNGNVNSVKFPALISTKHDGQREVRVGDQLLSRGLIPLPNKVITECLTKILPSGFDMELCVNNSLRETASIVRSVNKKVESLDVYVIDWVTDDDLRQQTPFHQRYQRILEWAKKNQTNFASGSCVNIRVHTDIQKLVHTTEELESFYSDAVKRGEEGIIIRDPNSAYTQSRSNSMLKWKRMEDDEGLIVDVDLNHNSATLEAFVLEWNGSRFRISSGLNARSRTEYYTQRKRLIGQYMKFTYQDVSRPNADSYGQSPRHPVLIGLRHPDDM